MHEKPEDDEASKSDYFLTVSVILPIIIAYIIIAYYYSENYMAFLKSFAMYFGVGLFGIWTYMEYY